MVGVRSNVEADSSFAVSRPIDPLLRAAAVRQPSPTAAELTDLYREHRDHLVRLATAITMDRAVAEEVAHEAFIGLQRHGASIENAPAYLQRSVVNRSINVIRRRSVAARHPVDPQPPASSPEVDETWAAVARLPSPQRAVVALRFWEDMTIDAIADTLGWPVGTVKSTLHRALKRLGEELT
ncbi:MAG: polymerase, sigma-24 subunit, subfamily [Ilumatobacteraceae bacterium]|nr:polymerase, sigma-24 subunit, subfamily [Ilumatobacteraceae bacterium]